MPQSRLSAVMVDTSVLEERLKRISRDELPFVKALSLNNLAKDTIRIEKFEMLHVFDRPKPFVLGGLRQLKYAKKKELSQSAVIGFTDVRGRFGNRVEHIVRAHIEGRPRINVAAERRLRSARIIGPNEFMINGDNAPKDRYGNIPLKVYRAAIPALIGKRRDVYRWFIGRAGSGRAIYRARGRERPVLVWYLTTDNPDYRPRFDFYGEAQRHADRFGGYFAQQAIRKAMKTRR